MARTFGAVNKDKPFRAAIVRALRIADNDPEKLDKIAQALVEAATEGKMDAIREIADRLDGKPAQAIIGDDESDPIQLAVIRRIIVKPGHSDSGGVPPAPVAS